MTMNLRTRTCTRTGDNLKMYTQCVLLGLLHPSCFWGDSLDCTALFCFVLFPVPS